YVLDNEFRRVPIGAVGELFLAGYQVANGYLNRPEETENAFLDNPFGDNEDYGIMYRTGDLVRVLPDGSLGIVGRHDSQVKIRGNRLELTEVESVIREIDYIEDVTVQTIRNETNNELVAYVVVNNDFDANELKNSISDYIREHKPDYMVPSFVVSINEIPLNVNGKVDKRALPDVDIGSLYADYVAPRNKLEMDIANAFEEVFNLEKIGIYDDFTVLGGDSLTAIKLLAIIGDYNLSAGDILSLHTPYAIAEAISKNNVEFDLDVYSLDSGCPLNEAQLNVYLDIVANEKTDAYLLPIFIEFSKNHNLNEIIDALNKMFEVHPILNMCVSDEFDVPYMVRNSEPQIIVESDVDNDFIGEFLTGPFDLHESLCRFLVIENDDKIDLYGALHHIICDAKSYATFKENLLAIVNGQKLEVDDSFLKVSAFTQQIQESELFNKAGDFYDSMLAECNEADTLLDSIGADASGTAQIDLDLDGSIIQNQPDFSENVLFTSVFAYTLSRFTGNDNVLFNIIDNGRDRFNNFNALGMYVNTLPLFVDCSDRDISSFIEYMSSLVYEVQSYDYYPFRLLANKYDIDANILFQFIPEWIDNNDNDVYEIYEKLDILKDMDDLIADLTFEVHKKNSEYYLNVIYCDKYSPEFISQFIQTYKLILHGIINADKLSDINYISNEDLKLLDEYNSTEHDLIYDDILDAFTNNLTQYPDSPLVAADNNIYSYAESAFIADKIAKDLTELGVKEQDSVSFLVERSEYYMFSVLGVLSIGAVYVPLDDNLPDNRIEFMIKDTDSKVVIVSDKTYGRANNLLNDDVVLLNISNLYGENTGELYNLPVKYGDLACILYTSGTTGIPKGVEITRKSLLNVSQDYVEKYDLNENDVYALFPSIGFDVSNFIINTVLYAGSCLNVIPEDIRLNMNEMNEYFIRHGVTHAFLTTQVGKLFMQSIKDIPLNVLLVAGEKLGLVENPNDCDLIDAYGPTESFAFVTSIKNIDKIHESSIGFLNINTKAYVLDSEFRRVPVGAVGELYLAGYQTAEGYLNREEETGKVFLDNPFEDNEYYGIMYRTGDMVRVLPNGSLGIVGRRDSQVKIRGNRLELTEVESVIRDIDYVNDVTVQTVKHDTNNELVAYVVVSKDMDVNELKDSICSYVNKYKPDYMVPSFVIALDEIPLNINGKVDRRALPEVDLESLSVDYVAPTNDIERHIVDVFEVVFNQKSIGLNDDFVRLGGDSITAIRVISLLQKNGINVAARDILNYK
ncbi:AMP-binding protein, partial [uncultured Methanobrevibacter sp.]|uniref:AMP-binding protein n=1 Tax=uncultured Methanobrevibacter sp. TaxID=253161 RepID=UPI0025CFFCE8